MKKVIAVVLAVLFLCSFSACEQKEPEIPALTDEQAAAELSRLLPLSMKLMRVFFGQGLSPVDGTVISELGGMQYEPVREGELYSSIAQMKADMEAVYSSAYRKELNLLMFEGYEAPRETTDESILTDPIDPRYRETDGKLEVDVQYSGYTIKTEPVAESAHVLKGGSTRVTVEMDYKIDGEVKGKMQVTLVLEKEAWYLDGPTY